MRSVVGLCASLWVVGCLFAGSMAQVAGGLQDGAGSAGTVSRVTLYRGQALVTRTVRIDGPAGSREIVVTDLPGTVLDTSLFAESADQVEVRAVRYRQRAVGEEPREEVRKLDSEIAAANGEKSLLEKKIGLALQKTAFLDQLQGFVAPTAQSEMTHGVLNAVTLRELTEFSFAQRSQIAETQVELEGQLQQVNDRIALLQRSRSELTEGAQKTVNEAVLFVEKLAEGAQTVELNYLVNGCGWSPSYTLRAAGSHEEVLVEYNALIQQVTGENWDGVQLTLSTASPALSARGPSLAAFHVTLQSADQQAQVSADPSGAQVALDYRANRSAQTRANEQLGNLYRFVEKTDLNWSINQMASTSQQFELANPLQAISSAMSDLDADDAPSLSYPLANPVSIASRTDQQVVRIFRGELASQFYHVATPLLSSYVFREAEIGNRSEIDLLAGPVTVYIDGRFVGRAEIPTVAQGETFVIGFGSDAQLRARRELAEKKEAVQGGNREMKMEYRIVVENYKNTPVDLRVMDRLPWSNHSADIRVGLDAGAIDLSTDPAYVRREKPRNILRWDVTVPAESAGEKAFEIRYSYTLDHDRNYRLADASNDQAVADEFRELERIRLKK